jgi:hypothetical protein
MQNELLPRRALRLCSYWLFGFFIVSRDRAAIGAIGWQAVPLDARAVLW